MTPRLLVQPAPPRVDVTEAEFLAIVVDLARWFNWEVYHTRTSIGSDHGWPDLVLARTEGLRGRALFRELKVGRNRATPEQRRWGDVLRAAGLDFSVWRPSDWRAIVAELTGEEG
jgi:hypothetical protein